MQQGANESTTRLVSQTNTLYILTILNDTELNSHSGAAAPILREQTPARNGATAQQTCNEPGLNQAASVILLPSTRKQPRYLPLLPSAVKRQKNPFHCCRTILQSLRKTQLPSQASRHVFVQQL